MNAPLRPALITYLLTSLVALATSANAQGNEDMARVRVIHASPGTPATDVLVNDDLALFGSVMFGDVTDYAEARANAYDVKVVPAGAGPESAAIQADLNLFYGTDYTVVALGKADSIRSFVLVDDNPRPEERQASVRFLHAVPDAPAVDIKVADGPFLFQDISFESLGDYVTIPMEFYRLEVRVAGTDTVVLELPNVALTGGSSFTMLATGLLEDASLAVLVTEDNTQATTLSPVPVLPARPRLPTELRAVGARAELPNR